MGSIFDSHRSQKIFSLPRVAPCFPLLGLTPSGLFMGLSSTIIYTSNLILCSTICVPSATRHNIHMYPFFLKFLLITQHDVLFINTSEATKRSSNRTERQKYRCHKPSKSCKLVNPILHKPPLQLQDARFVLVSIFNVPYIYLIMHNYRSNQSALMTRCETEFRHQYGIFGGKSQTSFTGNATSTLAGSEEGRLFSQVASRIMSKQGVN